MGKKNPNETRGGYRENSVKNSPVFAQPNVPAGRNTEYATFLMKISQFPPVDRNDVSALEQRFCDYLNLCAEFDMKVGNQAAYLALGITKDIVYQWEHGMTGTPAHHEFIKKVKQFCATYREGLMQDGQINPVTGIFWQKNYDGLKDTQDLVLTPNTQRLSDGDYQEIAEKYKQLPTMSDDE